MSCMRQIGGFKFILVFKIFYTIRYLVFNIQLVRPNSIQYFSFLNTELYSVFGIQILSIPNSIQYSVFYDF